MATTQHLVEGGILGRQTTVPGVLTEVRDGCQMRPRRQGQAGQALAAREGFIGPSRVAPHKVGICLIWGQGVSTTTTHGEKIKGSAPSPACRAGCTSFNCLVTTPGACLLFLSVFEVILIGWVYGKWWGGSLGVPGRAGSAPGKDQQAGLLVFVAL